MNSYQSSDWANLIWRLTLRRALVPQPISLNLLVHSAGNPAAWCTLVLTETSYELIVGSGGNKPILWTCVKKSNMERWRETQLRNCSNLLKGWVGGGGGGGVCIKWLLNWIIFPTSFLKGRWSRRIGNLWWNNFLQTTWHDNLSPVEYHVKVMWWL